MRTHHAIADGIAGVATFASFLDVTAETEAATPERWRAIPVPSDAELAFDLRRRRGESRRHLISALIHPVMALHRVRAAWPALRELVAEKPTPATSLDQLVGPRRTIALLRSDIDLVKAVAHAHGAKVNDVLLTAIAGGLRELFRKRGEPVDGAIVRVYVPVTLRQGDRSHATGNAIAQMVVPLPIGVSDPIERLRRISAETSIRKERSRPSLGKLPHGGLMGRAFLKLINRQHVNVTTADVPGPQIPLYLAGAEVLEVFPVIPLIGRVSLGIGAMSYSDQFNIGIVADADAYSDIDVLTEAMRRDFDALAVEMGPKSLQGSRIVE
jgi:WS/DGAT/MGAT family acyltransferase